jgi:hypothetical protein
LHSLPTGVKWTLTVAVSDADAAVAGTISASRSRTVTTRLLRRRGVDPAGARADLFLIDVFIAGTSAEFAERVPDVSGAP